MRQVPNGGVSPELSGYLVQNLPHLTVGIFFGISPQNFTFWYEIPICRFLLRVQFRHAGYS